MINRLQCTVVKKHWFNYSTQNIMVFTSSKANFAWQSGAKVSFKTTQVNLLLSQKGSLPQPWHRLVQCCMLSLHHVGYLQPKSIQDCHITWPFQLKRKIAFESAGTGDIKIRKNDTVPFPRNFFIRALQYRISFHNMNSSSYILWYCRSGIKQHVQSAMWTNGFTFWNKICKLRHM